MYMSAAAEEMSIMSHRHHHHEEETTATQVGDLPEVCLAQVIALTSPRDASRCAAVSPAFRAAADSDDVWRSFLPSLLDHHHHLVPVPAAAKSTTSSSRKKKDAYLGLCDAGALIEDGGGCVRVWLEKATGTKCYALSARRLSLPWDDGEFSWRWTPHPLSRFAEGHRGLSYPDQETSVSVGGRVVARHAVCLRPDAAEARKFWSVAGAGAEAQRAPVVRSPRLREDGWWEVEMGRLAAGTAISAAAPEEQGDDEAVVTASFEVLGWYPKRGLVVEAVEFRPVFSR